MYNYQTLFHENNIGYVVRCMECEKLQIGYGNLMLTFNSEEFESFRSWIQRIKDEQPPCQNITLRCIAIPTPCEGMKLLLSVTELNEFIDMLETADTELRSLAMMKLFE